MFNSTQSINNSTVWKSKTLYNDSNWYLISWESNWLLASSKRLGLSYAGEYPNPVSESNVNMLQVHPRESCWTIQKTHSGEPLLLKCMYVCMYVCMHAYNDVINDIYIWTGLCDNMILNKSWTSNASIAARKHRGLKTQSYSSIAVVQIQPFPVIRRSPSLIKKLFSRPDGKGKLVTSEVGSWVIPLQQYVKRDHLQKKP